MSRPTISAINENSKFNYQYHDTLSTKMLMTCLFPDLSIYPSDPTRSAAHCSGATRRGGSDNAGQRGECVCVRACVFEELINTSFYLSDFPCYMRFLCSTLQEISRPNQICI